MNDYGWADLCIGLSAQFSVVLSEGMLRQFAELSGDDNPLHGDDAFARRAGFPGRVAYGLLTSSFYSQLVGVHLPGRRALLHGIDIEFKAPAFIGDTLHVAGEIVHLSDAYQRLELKATITNVQGTLISKAKIRAGVHGP